MLGLLAERAAARGMTASARQGNWPAVAEATAPADVVTCYHVLYNVPDVRPFIEALTSRSRRVVVAELTTEHPLSTLNALWLQFHGLERPTGPTAGDLLAILTELGLRPQHQVWRRPGNPDYASFAELADVTRRRLCLPPERAADVAEALVTAGVDPRQPVDLGSSGREQATIWWKGTARG
jgi:hypothetical protein